MKKQIIIVLAVLIGCWPAGAHAPLKVNFHTSFNGSPLQYNTTYTVNGTQLKVNFLAYYITKIRFVKDDNTEFALDTVLLVKADQISSVVKGLETGHYSAIKFDIGIADTAINLGDPSVYPANHPLAIQSPSMHWSWSTGYIYLRLDGLVDTSASQTSGTNATLRFHLGTFPLVRTITISLNDYFIDGSHDVHHAYEADVYFHVEDFFTGIDLRQNRVTETMNNMMLAISAANNLGNAFHGTIREVTSVDNYNLPDRHIKIYPNPASHMLYISSAPLVMQPHDLTICDLSGKVLKTLTVQPGEVLHVDISMLSKGVYFVRDNNTSESMMIKVLIK